MLEGALIAFVGLAVGGIGGSVITAVLARARRNRPAKPPEAICGCGDNLAQHDPATGKCHAERQRGARWDDDGITIGYTYEQCTCRQYTGPLPLDTLGVYAQPVTDAVTGTAPSANAPLPRVGDDHE